MFEEISESITSRLKRRFVFLSILYLGIAIADLVEFWYTHQVDYGLKAAIWLIIAVAWAYRFRHQGEPPLTKLDIEPPTKD
jgi:hypothetical protein